MWWRLPDVDVADGRADAAAHAGDVAGGHAGGRTRRDMLLRSVLHSHVADVEYTLAQLLTDKQN